MTSVANMSWFEGLGGVLAFGVASLAGLLLLHCLRGLWRTVSIERGLGSVPSAPGGNIFIGHVLPLLKGTPWNIMAAWVMSSPPLVCQTITQLHANSFAPEIASNHTFLPASRTCIAGRGHCLLQVRLRILQRSMVIVGSAEGLKRVFQTNQRNYVKDLDFSFHPFLPILGTGLVTAQGKLWQQQRLLMAPTLRVDVLDDVVRPLLLSQTSSAGCMNS